MQIATAGLDLAKNVFQVHGRVPAIGTAGFRFLVIDDVAGIRRRSVLDAMLRLYVLQCESALALTINHQYCA